VHFGKALHDCQSNSYSAAFAITGLEHVEDRREPIGGNAAASVTHADNDFRWMLLDDEVNFATGVRKLDGVGEQVQDDLSDARRSR
jgi:hypothetical protein